MKTKTLTAKDFAWTSWTSGDIKKVGRDHIKIQQDILEGIKNISKDNRTFENTILPFETLEQQTYIHISPISVLLNLSPKKGIRKTAEEILNIYQAATIDMMYDPELYVAISELKLKKKDLDTPSWRLYDDTIKGFKRMGFHLPEKQQQELKKKKKQLSELGSAFDTANNEYADHILVTKEQLDGLPDTYIASLPKENGKFKVTLEYPHLFPFLNNSSDESARKKLSEKKSRHGGTVNLKRMEKIVQLRKEIAKLLGYDHHADYRLEERMAKNAKTVQAFLTSLEEKTRVAGKKDLAELKKLKKQDSKNPLGSHDVGYYTQKSLAQQFSIDHEMIREYFPLPHVTKKAFELFETLFGIKISKHTLPTWHKDVTTYKITDPKTRSVVGYFALDLFPRDGKFGHAAVSNARSGWKCGDGEYSPGYSVMMVNYRRPKAAVPSLLSHDEVTTYLHEFGHLLHGTLARAEYASQSGTSVAWDFVELPSQLMENWLWQPEYIKSFSKHYKTGKTLPDDTIKNLVDSKSHFVNFGTRRQVAFGLFDIAMHTNTKTPVHTLYAKTIKKVLGVEQPKTSLMPTGFGHMVGYDSGYYSYMWALVYAYDVFSEFEKHGITNKQLGKKLRKEILEVGSSRDEMETLKTFLGRKPSDSAFVKSLQ